MLSKRCESYEAHLACKLQKLCLILLRVHTLVSPNRCHPQASLKPHDKSKGGLRGHSYSRYAVHVCCSQLCFYVWGQLHKPAWNSRMHQSLNGLACITSCRGSCTCKQAYACKHHVWCHAYTLQKTPRRAPKNRFFARLNTAFRFSPARVACVAAGT
jgi:hypothetical protein